MSFHSEKKQLRKASRELNDHEMVDRTELETHGPGARAKYDHPQLRVHLVNETATRDITEIVPEDVRVSFVQVTGWATEDADQKPDMEILFKHEEAIQK